MRHRDIAITLCLVMTLVLISFCSFFFFTHHVITHIPSRLAIIVFHLIVLTNCQRLTKSYSHGEQINVEDVVFFSKNFQNNWKITVIVGSRNSDVFRKKVRNAGNHTGKHAGNNFSKGMNYNTNFCKMNFSKYCFVDSVNVFFNLRWFMYFWSTSFRKSLKWCFRIFTVSQLKIKQLKWNTMNKNNEHNQVAKN